jgi:hypothetical protein
MTAARLSPPDSKRGASECIRGEPSWQPAASATGAAVERVNCSQATNSALTGRGLSSR